MKWSQFNFLFYSAKMGYCLHNTRTMAFLQLDKTTYDCLQKIQKKPSIAGIILNNEDFIYLQKNKILIDDNDDANYINNLEYKKRLNSFAGESLGIILAPTLACNFACPYCYEKNLPENVVMSEDIQDKVITYINKYENKLKSMTLNWHGGEPLIAFETIKSFYCKLEKSSKVPLSHSSMVSNGYLLNEEICHFFRDKKLDYLQITVDGNRATHDKTRVLKNGLSSYDRIVDNIDMATELMPNCRIGIRANIGKYNRQEYIELYRELSARWRNKNCDVYYSFILDNNMKSCYAERCKYELTTKEKNNFEVDMADNGVISKKSLYSKLSMQNYTCSDVNSFVIDPCGLLYKCWADVGIKNRAIGDIVSGVTNYDIVSQFVIGTDKFADKKCLKCCYLPICDGGCNLYRVNFLENGEPYDVCCINDEGMIKYLGTFYGSVSDLK